MFTTKEGYITWLQNEIEAITNNGLKMALEDYERAITGEGKEKWFEFNNLSNATEDTRQYAWNSHIAFCQDQVKYMRRKIKKYEREISKTMAMA